jgi:hypothetical protein
MDERHNNSNDKADEPELILIAISHSQFICIA